MVSNPKESQEFGVYVRLFQKEGETRNVELTMPTLDRSLRIYGVDKFSQSLEDDGVIGLCVKTAGEITIYLSKPHWDSYDSQQREMLIFHELGHCVLNLEHDRSLDSDGVPNDLMYPVNFDSLYYFRYRKFYLDHLFKKVSKENKDDTPTSEETVSTCRWGLSYQNGKVVRVPITGKTKRHRTTHRTGNI